MSSIVSASLEVIESEVNPRIILESNLTATLDHITGEESPLGKELEGPVNSVVSKVVGGVAVSKGIKDSSSSTVRIQITILLITIRSDVLEAVDDAENFVSDLIVVRDHTFQAIGKAVFEGLADVLIEGVLFLLLHTNHASIIDRNPALSRLGSKN